MSSFEEELSTASRPKTRKATSSEVAFLVFAPPTIVGADAAQAADGVPARDVPDAGRAPVPVPDGYAGPEGAAQVQRQVEAEALYV